MSLPVPNLADPGPDYADNVNAALRTIDGHTHTGAPTDGLQLDLSTQLIKGDLNVQDHNLGSVRSVEFQSQPGTLVGSQDVNCLYVNAGVLGFNDIGGTFIPLTTGAVAPVTNNFSAVSVSTNHTILSTDAINFVGADSSAGPIAITVPRASTILPTPAWRYYLNKDTGGAAATHAITIQVTGGSGDTFAVTGDTSISIQTNLAWVGVFTDGVSLWYIHDTSTFNVGDTLDLNGATLRLTSATIRGTATVTGLTLSGDAAIALAGASSVALTAGAAFSVDSASTATVDCQLGASTGHALCYKVANITVANTGTTTLATTEYKCPIVVAGVVTLAGDATLAFPSVVGAIWDLNLFNITLAGHHRKVTVGTSAAQTLDDTKVFFRIICHVANDFYIFATG
jgi:hypothetical protein